MAEAPARGALGIPRLEEARARAHKAARGGAHHSGAPNGERSREQRDFGRDERLRGPGKTGGLACVLGRGAGAWAQAGF